MKAKEKRETMRFSGIETDVTKYLMIEMKKQANKGLAFLSIPVTEIEINVGAITENDEDYLRSLGYRISYKDENLILRW